MLIWLREQDPPCPWDEWATVQAARGGHLHVLRWLREQRPPCPWDRSACLAAAQWVKARDVAEWIEGQQSE